MEHKHLPPLYIEHEVNQGDLPYPKPLLTEKELAAATKKFVVVCTDVVLVDDKGRFILFWRKYPCAVGWWWCGGALNTNTTVVRNLERVLKREIGFVPYQLEFVGQFFHAWGDTRERPGQARTDLIFLHAARVEEAVLEQLQLDSAEYKVSKGVMRYDGSQSVRPVIADMFRQYHSKH